MENTGFGRDHGRDSLSGRQSRGNKRLQSWRLGFAIHDGCFHTLKTRGFDHFRQLAFGKSQPAIGVEFMGFGEGMFGEVQDQQPPAGFENAVGLRQRARRLFGMMQGLTEDGEVDGLRFDGDIFDFAEAEFEIAQAMALGEILTELDHFRRDVYGNDFFGSLCQKLRERTFTGTEVGYDIVVHHLDKRLGQCLPGPTRHVAFAEFSRQFIEVAAGLVLALANQMAQGG